MSTETIKPELLPVDVGGGEIHFVKRADYARRTADLLGLKFKAEIKKDHITQMLEGIDKGVRDPNPENPKPFIDTFNIVLEDYDAGVQKVNDDAAAALAQKEKDEKAAAELKEKQDAMLAKVRDTNPDFLEVLNKFDIGTMDRFIAKEGTSNEDLLVALKTGSKMGDFTGWMIGDLIVELEKRGQINVVQLLAEEMKSPYSTMYNHAKTAKAFPPDKRAPGVSYTIFREVGNAKFTEEQKKKELPALVNEISAGKHTSQTVREAVRKAQGKSAPAEVAPEDNETKIFILVDPGLEDPMQQVQTTKGFPKELIGGGVVIIDPATKLKYTQHKDKAKRWVALGEYVKPAPEGTTTPVAAAATPPAKKQAAKKKK